MTAAALTIQVRYFASVREAIGVAHESVSTSANTVQALREELIARGAGYASALALGKPIRAAINQVMVSADAPIVAQDGAAHATLEIAFFPPVTGG